MSGALAAPELWDYLRKADPYIGAGTDGFKRALMRPRYVRFGTWVRGYSYVNKHGTVVEVGKHWRDLPNKSMPEKPVFAGIAEDSKLVKGAEFAEGAGLALTFATSAYDEWGADRNDSTVVRATKTVTVATTTTGGALVGAEVGAEWGASAGMILGGPVGGAVGGVAGAVVGRLRGQQGRTLDRTLDREHLLSKATSNEHAQRVSLTVPDDWNVLEGYEETLLTVAEPPLEDGEQFATNVNVLRCDNDRGLDIGALLDETVRGLDQTLFDCVVLERSDEDARLLFTYRYEDFGLTADQRYVLDVDAYYVITATTTNGRFAHQSPETSAIVESFVLLERDPVTDTTTAMVIAVVVSRDGEEREYEANLIEGTVELDGEELPASVLATRLARIVGLAPRPQQLFAELVVVDRQLFDDHLATRTSIEATEARERLALPPETPEELAVALGVLPGAATGHWRVATPGTEGTGSPLEAIDGGGTGWWQLLDADESSVAVATSSSRLLWAQLTAVVASPTRTTP